MILLPFYENSPQMAFTGETIMKENIYIYNDSFIHMRGDANWVRTERSCS